MSDKITASQVHRMCRYLEGDCKKCPSEVLDEKYGPCVIGCYALAEEALEMAQKIFANPEDAA